MSGIWHKITSRLILMCLVILSTTNSVAENNNLSRAKSLMNEAEYSNAIQIISQRLMHRNVETKQKIELYWLQAVCYISINNKALAKSAFLKLLALDPTYKIDNKTSPKIIAAFNIAKEHMIKSGGFDQIYQPYLSPIDDHKADDLTVIKFTLNNLQRLNDIGRVILHARKQGKSTYTSIDLAADSYNKGNFTSVIPQSLFPEALDSYAVEYYVEVVSKSLTKLTGVASCQFPLTFLITNSNNSIKHSTTIIKSKPAVLWPYWVGIGAATIATGTVLGIVYLTKQSNSSIELNIYP
ncbi:MAG: hypothetical protein O2897_05935 [bacterium]|nr:hypothetical protein [bacterium]